MMCHRWLCHRIPAAVLTSSDDHANTPMRGQEALTWGPFIIVALKNLFYSGFTHLPTSLSPKAAPPLLSPPFVPPPLHLHHHPSLCLLQPPPPRPTSPSSHSSLSGWKVQWGCGIPEGQWGGGVGEGGCLKPEHGLCANRGLLISQSYRSTV